MVEQRPDRRRCDPESPSRSLGADRRDSPRLVMPIQIRASEGQPFVDCEGDLSLGGAYYTADAPPIPDLVEIRFRLPAPTGGAAPSSADMGPADAVEICCQASVVRSHREDSGRWGVHLAFRDMSLKDEQSLARFLDAHLLGKRSGG